MKTKVGPTEKYRPKEPLSTAPHIVHLLDVWSTRVFRCNLLITYIRFLNRMKKNLMRCILCPTLETRLNIVVSKNVNNSNNSQRNLGQFANIRCKNCRIFCKTIWKYAYFRYTACFGKHVCRSDWWKIWNYYVTVEAVSSFIAKKLSLHFSFQLCPRMHPSYK